jgi:hypothetical protein
VTAALAGRWHAVAIPVLTGLLVSGGGLVALGVLLREDTSVGALAVLLGVVGAGVGLTTAPVVAAALAAAGAPRAGLAAATVNVARELGGVVAVAGLGALAVTRLSSRLTATLVDAGIHAAQRPELLDALLGARTSEVRTLLLRDIGISRTLRVRAGLEEAATASFLSSTRLILVAAGCVLLALAALSAWLLRPLPTAPPDARLHDPRNQPG